MKRSRFTLVPVLAFAASVLAAPIATAQLEEDPETLNARAVALMEADNWEEALKQLTLCVERHDKNAPALFGPQFGVTWYRKGVCELKLKRWDDARKSFQTCYANYPNKGGQAEVGNLFNKRALIRWAEACQGAGRYEEAVNLFKKFLEERDKTRDAFDPGSFYISLAICHLKLGELPEGIEHLETAIKNKARFRTPDAGIVAGFQALVGAVVAKRDERTLLDFIDKNRAEIAIEPFEMEVYSRLFLKLAADAMGAGMQAGAIALYQLIPGTEVMVEDLKSRIARIGNHPAMEEADLTLVKAKLQKSLDALERRRAAGDPNETILLGATAIIHESHGNVRGAHAAYEQLELCYPKAKKREDNLYNLVRTSSVIGEVFATGTYGDRFLKAFPDSHHVPAVRRMMLTSLFYEGEYKTCIEVATEMLPKLAEGSNEHDIALHVLGGSHYYTGRYETARPLLDQHAEKYPKSRFEQATLYFQASNTSRLRFWSKAAGLLDKFFEKHPEPSKNPYYSFALFDRASCHYAENENAPALEKLTRLETEFPNADMIDLAFNLKGNVLQSDGNREEAETYYKKALELAERRGNATAAGESLFHLVSLLGRKSVDKDRNARLKDAVPYSDRFWEKYGTDSPYKAQMAVSQVHALNAAGRDQEALDRLRDVIARMANDPRAAGLEEAINSYTEVYLAKHGVDQLKDHYDHFPGIGSENKAALALLRIALIGVSEDQLEKAGEDQQAVDRAEARIKELFQELKNDFDVKILSNSILVRTGDFLREKTSAPRQALPYYDEALSRQDQSFRFAALLGRASVLAGGGKEEKAKAIEDLKRVFTDSQDKAEREHALFRIAETQMAAGDHATAAETANEYFDKKNGFTRFAPEVGLMLAKSYQERGMVNDALASYARTWSDHKELVRISAPAMIEWMKLSWQRNSRGGGEADRQGAYEAGWTYIDQTRRFIDKMTDDEKKQWQEIEKLVVEYESSPDVKSMAELKEEAARKK